jgi:hypothetical protein
MEPTKDFVNFLDKGASVYQNRLEQIVIIIHTYGSRGGIRHEKLASLVGLSGKWLRKYTQELISKGRIKRIGPKGPYYPVFDACGDPIIDAELFAGNFESLFISRRGPLAFDQNPRYFIPSANRKQERFVNFSSTSKYFELKFDNPLEERLFEFSNRLGAFLTYTIIQALNPDNFSRTTPAIQNQLSHQYIDASVLKIIQVIAQRFRQFFQNLVKTQYVGNRKPPNEVEIRYDPIFTYEKDIILLLLKAFSNIYPRLTLEFEMIREKPYIFKKFIGKTASPVERYKKRMNALHNYIENQKL